MSDVYHILVINPGSTSTKVALFTGKGAPEGDCSIERSAEYSAEPPPAADQTAGFIAQGTSRLLDIDRFLEKTDVVDCVAARGGMVRPIPAGIYRVNEAMVEDLTKCTYGAHASNLGAVLGRKIAKRYACSAIIADPVGVDELADLARFSGLHGIERRSFSHALNIRATVRKASDESGKAFAESRYVVAHLGGGISVAAVVGGKIIDVNNSNEGGPFTPQRVGTLPVLQLVDLCFSDYELHAEEVKRRLITEGGLRSYLGTDSVREVLSRIEKGDDYARLVLRAMAYQIGKEIGSMSSVLHGKTDGVLITGGFARSPITDWIAEMTDWIAPVHVYPGENEMTALAQAAIRYLSGGENLKEY